MATILITGGTGYIGSHTAIQLLQQGVYDVISIDNQLRSTLDSLDRIEAITGKRMTNYSIDLCDFEAVEKVFEAHPDIVGVIHFAALKAVGESVEHPLFYYRNNMFSTVNILECCEKYKVKNFIFSSSCTVYGNIDASQLPVTEKTKTPEAASPYGSTKVMGERVLQDFVVASETVNVIALRYFNPVGAHPSGKIGEEPIGRPNNLVPYITMTASGLLEKLTVFGGDYDTKDGSCVRDYIHVVDIADAHILALGYLVDGRNQEQYERYNLGSGNGVTVLEAIAAFEKVSGEKLNFEVGPRRAGDVEAIYSDSSYAKEKLGWETQYGIDDMMASAWKWQLTLNQSKQVKA